MITNTTQTDKKLIRAYSAPPFIYDIRGFLILTFSYRSTLWSQIRFFGNNMGRQHLDIAVGTGTLLYMIYLWRKMTKQADSEVIAIDYVPSMLAGGMKYFKNNPHIKLEVGDATHLDFPDNHFDTINLANAIHCIADVNAAIKEIYRVLKPGGTFATNALLFPKGHWPMKHIAEWIDTWGMKKGILETPYHLEDIRGRILSAGFSLVYEKVSGNSYDILVKKPDHLNIS